LSWILIIIMDQSIFCKYLYNLLFTTRNWNMHCFQNRIFGLNTNKSCCIELYILSITFFFVAKPNLKLSKDLQTSSNNVAEIRIFVDFYNALTQIFVSHSKQTYLVHIEPNPVITTSVYTLPRLWRQTFCGTN